MRNFWGNDMEKINQLLGIKESYQAPERLMEILLSDEREEVFAEALEMFDHDLSYDWFHNYFLDDHADRKKKKQDFTPDCISRLISAVLKPEGILLEPAAGTGGMIIQAWEKSLKQTKKRKRSEGNFMVIAQEMSDRTIPFLLFNLAIRRITAWVTHCDTLLNVKKDEYWVTHAKGEPVMLTEIYRTNPFDKSNILADFIIANPPFNLSGWNDGLPDEDPRWKYGIPPAGNANYAWLQHMIYNLAPYGRIGVVLPNGSLTVQAGNEGNIRRTIIEDDLIEGIVALPPKLFHSTQIPVCVWFLNRDKRQPGKILFVDARGMGTMISRAQRILTEEEIAQIAAAFEAFDDGVLRDVPGFCAVSTIQDIARQDYVLTPGRYVKLASQPEDDEPFEEKMDRLTNELSASFDRSHQLEEEIRRSLGSIGFDI